MITYKIDIDLEDFKAWSGGKDTLNLLIEQDLIEEVEDYINEIFYDTIPTETDINDILWFDEYVNDLIDWEVDWLIIIQLMFITIIRILFTKKY